MSKSNHPPSIHRLLAQIVRRREHFSKLFEEKFECGKDVFIILLHIEGDGISADSLPIFKRFKQTVESWVSIGNKIDMVYMGSLGRNGDPQTEDSPGELLVMSSRSDKHMIMPAANELLRYLCDEELPKCREIDDPKNVSIRLVVGSSTEEALRVLPRSYSNRPMFGDSITASLSESELIALSNPSDGAAILES